MNLIVISRAIIEIYKCQFLVAVIVKITKTTRYVTNPRTDTGDTLIM